MFKIIQFLTVMISQCSCEFVLLPSEGDKDPWCYEVQNYEDADEIKKRDPLAKNHVIEEGTCENEGFGLYLRMDPVFTKAALFSNKQAIMDSAEEEGFVPTEELNRII